MTAPAVAAGRFVYACGLGAALGLCYGFLRPLGRKCAPLGDALFLLALGRTCLYLGFGICGGDLRLGYFCGLAVGGFLWEAAVGPLFRPVFDRIWEIILVPVKNFGFLQNFCLHLRKNGLQ